MTQRTDCISVKNWGIFPSEGPLIIAGPCSAESREQVLETARLLSGCGVRLFRAGLWKPRTHPGSFEGVGEAGLEWLLEAKERYSLKICTEVASKSHVEACLKAGMDLVWIGARTTTNPFQVQEIAEALSGCDIPVLIKNPVCEDMGLWCGAVERMQKCSIKKLGLVYRGIPSNDEKVFRNSPEWSFAIEMRMQHPELPLFCDPSHISGNSRFVPELSMHAMDMGFDGLMIESHCEPSRALSDASQQLQPAELGTIISSACFRKQDCDDDAFQQKLSLLRSRIDEIDHDIIALLASRMDVSRKIGECKRDSKVTIIQTSRWEKVLEKCRATAVEYGVNLESVTKIFNAIHEASVEEQNNLLK